MPGSVFKIVTAIAGLGSGRDHADDDLPAAADGREDGLARRRLPRPDGHTGVPARPFDLDARDRGGRRNIWYALDRAADRRRRPRRRSRRGWASARRSPFDLPTAASQVTNGGGTRPAASPTTSSSRTPSYGQAETLVTPLQMALVAATVANGGTLMQPHLVIAHDGPATGRARSAPEQLGA